MKDHEIEVDPLALGLTQAPVFMGIPLRLFFANLAIHTLLCIDLQTLVGIPFFLLLHLILFRFSIKDPQFYRVYLKYITQTPPLLNYGFWGGTNSYSPG